MNPHFKAPEGAQAVDWKEIERQRLRAWAMDLACAISNRLRIGMSDADLETVIKILLKHAQPKPGK